MTLLKNGFKASWKSKFMANNNKEENKSPEGDTTPTEQATNDKIANARQAAQEDTDVKENRQFVAVKGGKDTYVVRDRHYFRDVRVYKKQKGCEDPKAAAESYARKLNNRASR